MQKLMKKSEMQEFITSEKIEENLINFKNVGIKLMPDQIRAVKNLTRKFKNKNVMKNFKIADRMKDSCGFTHILWENKETGEQSWKMHRHCMGVRY